MTDDHRRKAVSDVPTTDVEIQDMILRHEGGTYTNHPSDRGGPTKWGVTLRALRAWLKRETVSIEELQALTREDAARFYQEVYIRPFHLFEPNLFRANVIDMSVNAGLSRGIQLAQQTLGVVVDGIIGKHTAEAASLRDWNPLFVGVRLAFYERIIERDSTQLVWRNGWRSRALSFFGTPHRLPVFAFSDLPVFGHNGKAYLNDY